MLLICVGLSDISERCGGNFIFLVGRSSGAVWVEDFAFGLIVLYVVGWSILGEHNLKTFLDDLSKNEMNFYGSRENGL